MPTTGTAHPQWTKYGLKWYLIRPFFKANSIDHPDMGKKMGVVVAYEIPYCCDLPGQIYDIRVFDVTGGHIMIMMTP